MNRSILTLIIVLYTVTGFAQAPNWEWARIDNGTSVTAGAGYRKQAVAVSKNVLVWATLQNSKYTATPSAYGDYHITEYNLAGNLLNSASITGKVCIVDIKADTLNNWYILGKYNDSLQFGTLSRVNSNLTAPYYFLMKVDGATLGMVWFKDIGTNYYSSAESIFVKGDNLYIAVDSALTSSIYKIDINTGAKTLIVRQAMTGHISSVAADELGNIYVAGSCPSWGVDTFGSQTINITNLYYSYIVRYKANGTFDWIKFMNDITCTSRKLSIANSNTIYYTGAVHDTMTLGSFHIPKPLVLSGANYLAASLDSTGGVRWVKQGKDSTACRADMEYLFNAEVVDSMLVIMPTARIYNDFGNGITSAFGTQTAVALVAYTPSGVTNWLRRSNTDMVTAQHLGSNGRDLWITGMARDSFSLDFDTVSVSLASLTQTPFLAKLNVTDEVCALPPAVNAVPGNGSASFLWPPVAGAMGYEYSFSTSGTPPASGTFTTNASALITTVSKDSTYYFCLRTMCAPNLYSPWACTMFKLGIQYLNKNVVSIYPNPATHSINIAGLNGMHHISIRVMNIAGSLVGVFDIDNPKQKEYINVSSFARGSYFVEIKAGDERMVQKIVLE